MLREGQRKRGMGGEGIVFRPPGNCALRPLRHPLTGGDCAHKCTIHSLPTPRNLEKESCEILNEGKCSRREARKRGRGGEEAAAA